MLRCVIQVAKAVINSVTRAATAVARVGRPTPAPGVEVPQGAGCDRVRTRQDDDFYFPTMAGWLAHPSSRRSVMCWGVDMLDYTPHSQLESLARNYEPAQTQHCQPLIQLSTGTGLPASSASQRLVDDDADLSEWRTRPYSPDRSLLPDTLPVSRC